MIYKIWKFCTFVGGKIDQIDSPSLPRKRKKPKYSILNCLDGCESSHESYHPESPSDHYKQIYIEALDIIISSIKDRFDEPGYKIFSNVEGLLLKAISKEDYSTEMAILSESYSGDYDQSLISSELDLLPTLFKNSVPTNFDDIINVRKSVKYERKLLSNVIKIVRIVLTSGICYTGKIVFDGSKIEDVASKHYDAEKIQFSRHFKLPQRIPWPIVLDRCCKWLCGR